MMSFELMSADEAGPEQPGVARRTAEAGERLRKPQEMVVMVPRSQKVTLTGRRMYNVLLHLAQRHLEALSVMPAADEVPFEAPLAHILRTSGSSVEDRTVAKRYLREMKSLTVDWESTAPGDGIKYRGFNMLAEVVLEQRGGENWVSWTFPPTIMGALREPQRWARLELDIMARLGTYAAIALYEICARYRDNPAAKTSRKPPQWWTDALSPTPPGAERREWRKFKNERIKPAVAEINEVTDLDIELIEHKQGRAVDEVQFLVRRKASRPEAVLPAQPVEAHLVARFERLGVSEARLDALLREFGTEAVRAKLDALERRAASRGHRGLDNPYAWLRSVLRDPEGAGASSAAAPASGPAPANAPVRTPSAPSAPSVTSPQLREAFEALPAAERQAWVRKVFDELKDNPIFKATSRKRVREGDYLHGVFGAMLLARWEGASRARLLEASGEEGEAPAMDSQPGLFDGPESTA